MPLPSPNLDDRSFDELRAEAIEAVRRLCPEWTDLSPSDPGITLLEVFAFLTDALLFRLNRLPEKAYVAFLDLVGIRQQPPAAASTQLAFSVKAALDTSIVLPQGTKVTTGAGTGAEAPIFVTVADATLAAGATTVTVPAFHAELVEYELAGESTGQPGQQVQVARPPIVLSSGADLPLRVFVEAAEQELVGRPAAAEIDGRGFREWREVDAFVDIGHDRAAYLVSRLDGTISFAPAVRQMGPPEEDGRLGRLGDLLALAEVPAAGRAIRVSYWRGGGAGGNVAAGLLTQLVDRPPIAELSVSNPHPATGGQDGETVENAMRRGPQELHRFGRAVTARDFDLVAQQASGAVGRARTFSKAALWRHAEPGTVQSLLVPNLSSVDDILRADAAEYESRQTDEALDRVTRALDAQSILGLAIDVAWTRYKKLWIEGTIVIHRGENPAVVEPRLERALRSLLSPLPLPVEPTTGRAAAGAAPPAAGWPFGQPLRASDLYDVLLRDQSVRFVERLVMHVADAPREVTTITSDLNQEHTWYCGSAGVLFRTMDDGEGWDPVATFDSARVEVVRSHPAVPGLVVAACAVTANPEQSEVWASRDCGETWLRLRIIDHVNDLAVLHQPEGETLFLAGDRGLFRMEIPAELSGLAADPVTPDGVQLGANLPAGTGLYAVAVVEFDNGDVSVAVTLKGKGGILISHRNGQPGSFNPPVQLGADVRRMCVRAIGSRRFLFAALTAEGTDVGYGALALELFQAQQTPANPTWTTLSAGWTGGGCRDLAVAGDWLVAGSHRGGVLRLDLTSGNPVWTASSIDSRLPPRQPPEGPFHPVEQVAVSPDGVVLVAAARHLFRLSDVTERRERWQLASSDAFSERVTLSPTWLFCPGTNQLMVKEQT